MDCALGRECPLLTHLGYAQNENCSARRSAELQIRWNWPEATRSRSLLFNRQPVPVSCLVKSEPVIAFCFMDTDRATLDDLAILRSAFENGTPLGWEAVHAFEEQQGIVLPEPYRTFVSEITDGATAGPPDYGMVKLGSPPPAWQERDLTKPFPLTERPDGELRPLLEPVYNHGSLVLGTDGCAMYWHLIVTGPHRGQVWHITDVGAQPFGAEFGYTTARSGFAGWVRHWVEGKDWFDVTRKVPEQ
jgi:hypothetical protein